MFLEALLPSSITLTGQVASIEGTVVPVGATTFKEGNVQFNFNGTNTLSVQALTSLNNEHTYNLILTDGSKILLTVQQTVGAKNVIIASLNFSGTLFQPPLTGFTVLSYVITGQTSPIYSPNQQYALPNGGTILINSDGTYQLSNPSGSSPYSFTVSYGGTSGGSGSITLSVQGNTSDVVNITQPSYTFTVPASTLTISVQGTMLTQGTPYTLTGNARFTWVGTNLLVDNISSSFGQTTVQVESDTSTSSVVGNIQINEYLFTLVQDVPSVTTIVVPTGTTIGVVIPVTPIAISYGGTVIKGNQANFPIVVEQMNIGSFNFEGQLLTIISTGKSGYSKILGFTSSAGTTTYYQIQFTSSVSQIPTLPGAIINYPNAPIGVVGDASGQVFPIIGGNITLNNRVQLISNTSIVILTSFALLAPYTFYVTLTDGTVYTYIINFQNINIFVPVITKFSMLAIIPSRPNTTSCRNIC